MQHECDMKTPKNITRQRPAAAKLRSWRVIIIRSRGEYLGSVEAPDRERAEAVAIKQFALDDNQRRRLLIREPAQPPVLRCASSSNAPRPLAPPGEWDADDFDVAADGAVVGASSRAAQRP
jgi:hypothetical protein